MTAKDDKDMPDTNETPRRHTPREINETALLDAAEQLLIDVGYADITTRKLAQAADVNLGLIHYYFGSMDELFLRVLERFTDRLIARQRAMYASDDNYSDKWRQAMRYLEADRPYQKVWFELIAMSWNRPEYKRRVAQVRTAWRDAMYEAVATALSRYSLEGLGLSVDAWVTLIMDFNAGMIHDRLSGVGGEGHTELLTAIQGWLDGMERQAAEKPPPTEEGSNNEST